MTRFEIALGKDPPKIPFIGERSPEGIGLWDIPIGSLVAVDHDGKIVPSAGHKNFPIIGVKVDNVSTGSVIVNVFNQGDWEIPHAPGVKKTEHIDGLYIDKVTVMPMTHPVGLAYALRMEYNGDREI
jgi:hypothetical protein